MRAFRVARRARTRRRAQLFTRDTRCVMPLDDGEYDCVVTDVARGDDGVVVIDIAIASGDAKGNVVRLRSSMPDEPVHWLGMPGRLKVVDGTPSFRLDSA